MPRINPEFQYDVYRFLHKPLRDIDQKDGDQFLERFLVGVQTEFENMQSRISDLETLRDPAKIRADLLQYLKAQVGFTNQLNNITNDLSENDLRKLITLAVALWKQKGTEPGYSNIVRLFVGKTARIFNWFDFRFVVGEKAFGEEQLGEDSWFISVPNIEGSEDHSNNVVLLLPFESNSKDRSIVSNDAFVHSPYQYYSTPNSGFPNNSEKYVALQGGVVEVSNSAKYDLSGDFTVEFFFRSKVTEGNKTIFHKMFGGIGVKIEIDKSSNQISFELNDGVTSVTGTLNSAYDLDDNIPLHIALVVDRENDGARLYVGGTESTAKIALGLLGDVSNIGRIYIGGEGVGISTIMADVDSFRLALNSVYDVDTGTLAVPFVGFIEYQEEQLDEFKTDVRIVDDGSGLNKTLIMRILNLMRPVSERIRVIFVRFYDDFIDGIGQFDSITGSASLNSTFQMEISPSTVQATAVFEDTEFQDIVLQVKANDYSAIPTYTGGVFSVLFFFQDIDNYYEFRIDTANRRSGLFKKVAGVESQISAWVDEDIVPKTSYIFTVATDLSEETGETVLKAYIDSNKQHEVVDASFVKGKFGMKTDSSTIMQVDEIEMMEIPADIRLIEPGLVL